MAARTGARASMLGGGASESEDDLATAAANGARKTSNRSRTSMAAAKTATKRKAAPKHSRQPLKDKTNVQSDGQDDNDYGDKPKPKRAKTTRKPETKKVETLGTIPETQPEVADVEQSIEVDADAMDIGQAPSPQQVQRFVQRQHSASVQHLQPRASARSVSALPGYPPARDRSGSVSGTERERRGGDPDLRRKLNDLTKKHENLNLKYQSLQEIGKRNEETNFEKLKRASDEKAKTANELIASLKKEIAELRKVSTSRSAESDGLQKQVSLLTNSNEKLTTETVTLKERLQTSQNEVKSLEAKLMAARQQISNGTQEGKVPTSGTHIRSLSVSTSDTQKEAKMKENLYSDLTGLIVRGVKRKEGEDEYDCIQTGRNGTLHFHLLVANDSSTQNPKTPSGLSYEDAEFSYEPFLDESRDRDLINILPDYLAEDICFPRSDAVKFYSKVAESMSKKIVVEED